jgi:hypothetical protein
MARDKGVRTLQSNIKNNTTDMTGYSLFLGGLNVKRAALEQYNVLKTGKGRIFLTKMPYFMKELMPEATKNFKHVIEYGFMNIDGIQDLTMEFDQITGGYAGRQFEIPTILKDDTNEITIKILEFAGSPMREYVEMWLSGVSDPNSGFTHYHGLAIPYEKNGIMQPAKVEVSQANHTMEAFYVMTDATGFNIEFACMLCNMFPKGVARNQFNQEPGTSAHVELDLAFTCTMYTSPDINAVAQLLLNKYRVLYNYLDFQSDTAKFDTKTGLYLDPNEFAASNIKDWTMQ